MGEALRAAVFRGTAGAAMTGPRSLAGIVMPKIVPSWPRRRFKAWTETWTCFAVLGSSSPEDTTMDDNDADAAETFAMIVGAAAWAEISASICGPYAATWPKTCCTVL